MDKLLEEKEINLRTLFEAGVHFGHPTRKWNPKMDSFIFTKKSKSHVINLEKTLVQLQEARKLIIDIVSQGGECIFVGTKLQARSAIQSEAERCESFYVNQRWLGGMLTNFETMKSRVDTLKNLETKASEQDDKTLSKSSEAFCGVEYGPTCLVTKPSLTVSKYIHLLARIANGW